MINLNGSEFNSPVVAIFNNGVAGRVDNVSISVEKRKLELVGTLKTITRIIILLLI